MEEREGLARIPCVVNGCSRTFAPGKDQARSSIKRHCSERGIAGDAEHLEEYRNMEGDGTGVTIERRVVMPEVVMPEEKGCGIWHFCSTVIGVVVLVQYPDLVTEFLMKR